MIGTYYVMMRRHHTTNFHIQNDSNDDTIGSITASKCSAALLTIPCI